MTDRGAGIAQPAGGEGQIARIGFVCTGNICRSPMGEVIFRDFAIAAGAAPQFEIFSRGTHGYHVGSPADPRTIASLAAAGFDGTAHRAARLSDDDIRGGGLLIALDRGHERIMRDRGASHVRLLTDFDPLSPSDPDVFDPYYSSARAFDEVRDQVVRSCRVLLDELLSGRLSAHR